MKAQGCDSCSEQPSLSICSFFFFQPLPISLLPPLHAMLTIRTLCGTSSLQTGTDDFNMKTPHYTSTPSAHVNRCQ
ncbi:hypothetical protein XENOCAPTIV_023004 [Xenoophorus captivus]|uniref:Uncharacterized protein n=1 Tax=Xenoophorus captivus TaxID=1517983 RepID=A0ABV0R1S6_9TELE